MATDASFVREKDNSTARYFGPVLSFWESEPATSAKEAPAAHLCSEVAPAFNPGLESLAVPHSRADRDSTGSKPIVLRGPAAPNSSFAAATTLLVRPLPLSSPYLDPTCIKDGRQGGDLDDDRERSRRVHRAHPADGRQGRAGAPCCGPAHPIGRRAPCSSPASAPSSCTS